MLDEWERKLFPLFVYILIMFPFCTFPDPQQSLSYLSFFFNPNIVLLMLFHLSKAEFIKTLTLSTQLWHTALQYPISDSLHY